MARLHGIYTKKVEYALYSTYFWYDCDGDEEIPGHFRGAGAGAGEAEEEEEALCKRNIVRSLGWGMI